MTNTLLIGGEWQAAASGAEFETLDPATGQPHAQVSLAGAADADAAVRAARAALEDPEWAGLTPARRARILWRIGDLIEEHAEELAELETRDQGQPLGISMTVSVAAAAEHFRYYAGWVTKIYGETAPLSIPGVLQYTKREPVGVCALITPWNFPLMIASWKIAPALACGNTVIVKPAEQTPMTTVRLVELCRTAGVPDGAINLLTGGPEAGRALVEHPGVDKVSFTGSTETGRDIVRASAGNLKRVTLELGGKAPASYCPAPTWTRPWRAVFRARSSTAARCAPPTPGSSSTAPSPTSSPSAAPRPSAGCDSARAARPTPNSAPWSPANTATTSTHWCAAGSRKAPSCSPAGPRSTTCRASSTSRPCSRVYGTTCASPARRSSARCCPSCRTTTRTRPSPAPTTPSTAWRRPYGPATWARRTAWPGSIRAGTVFINMPNPVDASAPWGGFKASGWGREMGSGAIDAYTEVKSVWTSLA